MPNNDDFFSPHFVNDDATHSPIWQNANNGNEQETEPDLLVSQLRTLYSLERKEHERSLQRVWERLAQCYQESLEPLDPAAPQTEEQSKILRPFEPVLLPPASRGKSWIKTTRKGMSVLAASLLMLTLVGSMLVILSTGHQAILGIGVPNTPVTTPSPSALTGYPPPGITIATSPPSFDAISALSWAPDGRHLAGSTQGKAWIWDMNSGEYSMVTTLAPSHTPIKTLAWSPNGRYLAIGTNPVQVIDTTDHQVHFTYSIYAFWPTVGDDVQAHITALTWSPDSNLLAIAALRLGNGCVVQIRDIRQSPQQVANSYPGEISPTGISSVSWSAGGRFLAWADGEAVQVWDTTNNSAKLAPFFEQKLAHETSVAWSPDEPALLAFTNGSVAQVWNIEKQAVISQHAPAGNGALAWSPDGNYLASANQNQVDLWNAHTGKRLYTYSDHASYVHILAWSPNGKYLASGENAGPSRSSIARIWSA